MANKGSVVNVVHVPDHFVVRTWGGDFLRYAEPHAWFPHLVIHQSVDSVWPHDRVCVSHRHTGLVLIRCADNDAARQVVEEIQDLDWNTDMISHVVLNGPALDRVRRRMVDGRMKA